jgi:hypothetical protein
VKRVGTAKERLKLFLNVLWKRHERRTVAGDDLVEARWERGVSSDCDGKLSPKGLENEL